MTTTAIAKYSYDTQGRLRAEWDPQVTPAVETTYGYDAEGHVTAVASAGRQPWLLGYGTSEGDATTGATALGDRAPQLRSGDGLVPREYRGADAIWQQTGWLDQKSASRRTGRGRTRRLRTATSAGLQQRRRRMHTHSRRGKPKLLPRQERRRPHPCRDGHCAQRDWCRRQRERSDRARPPGPQTILCLRRRTQEQTPCGQSTTTYRYQDPEHRTPLAPQKRRNEQTTQPKRPRSSRPMSRRDGRLKNTGEERSTIWTPADGR